MSAARTDDSRRVDWSAVKGDRLALLTAQVVRFVRGIRGPREGSVTRKQIVTWFHGTPEAFVMEAIMEAVMQERIRCQTRSLRSNRRANGAHVYVVEDTNPKPTPGTAQRILTAEHRIRALADDLIDNECTMAHVEELQDLAAALHAIR